MISEVAFIVDIWAQMTFPRIVPCNDPRRSHCCVSCPGRLRCFRSPLAPLPVILRPHPPRPALAGSSKSFFTSPVHLCVDPASALGLSAVTRRFTRDADGFCSPDPAVVCLWVVDLISRRFTTAPVCVCVQAVYSQAVRGSSGRGHGAYTMCSVLINMAGKYFDHSGKTSYS